MDPSPIPGYEFDASNCHNLDIEEKRELIHQLSRSPEAAAEKMKTWRRQVLVEVLCAEMGSDRKYGSLTKPKLIETLIRIVSEKKSWEHIKETDAVVNLHSPSPPPFPLPPLKRQRKTDHPSRLPVLTSDAQVNHIGEAHRSIDSTDYCLNLACKAILSQEYAFCKRCSCCICHKYDENKDPSLWLVCSSEVLSDGEPCGLSCHLDCALKHERTGILKTWQTRLDGSYYCISCGKVNDLLRCWRKQLMIAKDARRVDVLCYRVFLCHKLLSLTKKYQGLHEMVDAAVKKLESEVGTLSGSPSMTRGIVNRLSVGADVQKLCALAVESLDSMLSSALPLDAKLQKTKPSFVKFEYASPTSVTLMLGPENDPSLPPDIVGFTLWLRKADVADYPTKPTHTLVKAEGRFLISDLTPATDYIIKVVAFDDTKELAKWEVGMKTESIVRDIKRYAGEGTSMKRHCEPQKIISSGRSAPSSEGDESNSTDTYRNLSQVPRSICGYLGKPENTDSEESTGLAETNVLQNPWINTTLTMQSTGHAETPGYSGSILDEEPNSLVRTESHKDSTNSTEHNHMSDLPKSDNDSNTPTGVEMAVVPHGISGTAEPATPCRLEAGKEGSGRSGNLKPSHNIIASGSAKPVIEPGSSSKRRIGVMCEDNGIIEGQSEVAYEYCVKVIRWLECEGHLETNFRVKLLTWFSLRANAQEKRVLNVYVRTLLDDPVSLAGQLVDTFSESIFSKRPSPVPTGFCNSMWH